MKSVKNLATLPSPFPHIDDVATTTQPLALCVCAILTLPSHFGILILYMLCVDVSHIPLQTAIVCRLRFWGVCGGVAHTLSAELFFLI